MFTIEHVMTFLGVDRHRLAPPADARAGGQLAAGPEARASGTTTLISRRGRSRACWRRSRSWLPCWSWGRGTCRSSWGTGWSSPDQYHFSVKFVFDRLSVPMAILSFTLSGHDRRLRQPVHAPGRGYNRFFVLYTLFVLGMVVTSLAGTIETLFAGWELVGLSSALLVAFFQERQAPRGTACGSGSIYRVSDAALLLAAVVDAPPPRARATSTSCWGPGSGRRSCPALTAGQALVVGLLVLVAAAGKSALVPFSGWLPRAMEGPTPSSAVFYGALSVHLGAFLLLRVSPLLDASSAALGAGRGLWG